MIDFLDVCKRVNTIFKRGGYPGIGDAVETKDSWIFSPAPEIPGEVEYGGLGPFLINKKTGELRHLNFVEDDDWMLMQIASKIDVPKEFMPQYSR